MSNFKIILIDKPTRKLLRGLATPGEDTHETIRRLAERELARQQLAAARVEHLDHPKAYEEA